MLKIISLFLITLSSIHAQGLNSTLIQRGGTHNAIFLNPAKLTYQNDNSNIKADFLNSSLSLSDDSFTFLKELKDATSSSNKNREISELLKKNIGKTLSFSAHNFSSLSQNKKEFAWSVGIAHTIDGYFITHSGFGSKGAMESFMEKYKALVTTLALKKESFNYGINLKVIEKTNSIHNYSIQEMIENSSFSDYFDSKNSQKENAIGVDVGLTYTLNSHNFNPKFSLSLLDIGDTSFQNIGTLPSTTNIGLSVKSYKNISLEIDYLDLFKHQKNQHFEDAFRVHLSKDFFNKQLKLNSGILQNALSYGVEYNHPFFTIALDSYKRKTYQQEKERKYELSIALSW
jgi:hypothetical protein